MSILKNLERLSKKNCINCIHLDILPDEPLSFRWDCFSPDLKEGDPQYYWSAYKENDCKYFKRKPAMECNLKELKRFDINKNKGGIKFL